MRFFIRGVREEFAHENCVDISVSGGLAAQTIERPSMRALYRVLPRGMRSRECRREKVDVVILPPTVGYDILRDCAALLGKQEVAAFFESCLRDRSHVAGIRAEFEGWLTANVCKADYNESIAEERTGWIDSIMEVMEKLLGISVFVPFHQPMRDAVPAPRVLAERIPLNMPKTRGKKNLASIGR